MAVIPIRKQKANDERLTGIRGCVPGGSLTGTLRKAPGRPSSCFLVWLRGAQASARQKGRGREDKPAGEQGGEAHEESAGLTTDRREYKAP